MTAQPVLGKTTWMIADGYMSDTVKGEFVSHEAVCVLNLSGATAHIDLTLFFEDCEPLTGLHAVCEDRRTNHIRLDRMVNDEGKRIPRNKPYAILVQSDRPIVVQCSRLMRDCAKNPEQPFTKRAGYDTMRAEKGGVII